MAMKKIAMYRKLHILRSLTKSKSKSKSVKKRSMDAILHTYKLKLQVAEIQNQKEYQYLINHFHEVRVEKLLGKPGYLWVRISCMKTENLLVSILETFEEMNLVVLQASLTCKHLFAMNAIVKADDVDASILNRALLMVIDQGKKCNVGLAVK